MCKGRLGTFPDVCFGTVLGLGRNKVEPDPEVDVGVGVGVVVVPASVAYNNLTVAWSNR